MTCLEEAELLPSPQREEMKAKIWALDAELTRSQIETRKWFNQKRREMIEQFIPRLQHQPRKLKKRNKIAIAKALEELSVAR